MTKLSRTFTADGVAGPVLSGPLRAVGGFDTIIARGTFGSGTLTVYVSPDTYANAVPVTDAEGNNAALSADGMINVTVRGNLFLVLTGSTGADIDAWVV